MHTYNYYLSQNLFPNGGEFYSFSQLKEFLSALGLNPKQVAGTIGAGVRHGFLINVGVDPQIGECVFTR